ncbi:MAG: hypothetical protein R3B07_06965 [Polyangiaceae bacterium]
MSEVDVRALISELLSKMKLRAIVYVDDLFDSTVERICEEAESLSSAELQGLGLVPASIFDSGEDAVERRLFRRHVEDLEASARRLLFGALLDSGKLPDGDATGDASLVSAFLELVPEGVSCKTFGAEEWDAQKDTVLEADDGSTLFLFDDDLSRGGGGPKDGRRYLVEVLSRGDGVHRPCALLTHNVTTAADEDRVRTEIADGVTTGGDALVVIAKSHLHSEAQDFPARLKVALLGTRFAKLKSYLAEALKVAHVRALARVEELSVEDFESIVFNSSIAEGAWAPDTLLRIYSVGRERGARMHLRTNEDVHKLVSDVEPVLEMSLGVSPQKARASQAAALQRGELYEGADDVNSAFLPVGPGDLFQVAGKPYVLVGQACDMAIRSTGLRAPNADSDAARVVAVAPICNYGDRVTKGHKPMANHFTLEHYDVSREFFFRVALAKAISLPLWIVDLVGYNAKGCAELASDRQISSTLTTAMAKRLGHIRNVARSACIRWASVASSIANERTGAEVRRCLVGLPPCSSLEVELDGAEEDWTVKVSIERTGRISEPMASALTLAYGQFLSRPAMPHDLTRFG